ncbi:MAG: efflux RND transporter periplasmic adaptor subunit [Candidatus Tectomicrobia bacterium]|nr:efflux RND transporter periplasmic adaptor subunit [Candidatus Tectomicrobia bacterium]
MRRLRILILTTAFTAFLPGPSSPSAQPPRREWGPAPVAVVVSPVTTSEISSQITAIGTVEAQLSTTVSAEIEGLTQEYPLQEGDRVEKGKTVLVRLKNSDRRINLAEAEAAYRRAVAQHEKLRKGLRKEEIEEVRAQLREKKALMEKYQRDLERAAELLRSKIINLSEYNRTESDYLAAKYQVQRMEQSLRLAELGTREEDIAGQEAEVQRQKANLDRMRDELEKTILRAPVSGFITKKYVEVGQWLQRGGQVAEIINIDTVLVRTGIPERHISNVSAGDRALITVDAYPGKTFEGRVRHIIPQADIASRTFPVKIEVANADYLLKGGMFARVTLFYGPRRPALMVPKDALSTLGTHTQVFVAENGRARAVSVRTGRVVEGLVEIVQGDLSQGDQVIVTGNEALQNDRPILIRAVRTPEGKILPVKAPAGQEPPGSGPPGGPWPKDGRGGDSTQKGRAGAQGPPPSSD